MFRVIRKFINKEMIMSKKNKLPGQKTITEMDEAVRAGMAVAREAIKDDPELIDLHDKPLFTWSKLASQVIIVAVGLSAFKTRSPEQTIIELTEYNRMMKAGIEQQWSLVKTEGNA